MINYEIKNGRNAEDTHPIIEPNFELIERLRKEEAESRKTDLVEYFKKKKEQERVRAKMKPYIGALRMLPEKERDYVLMYYKEDYSGGE